DDGLAVLGTAQFRGPIQAVAQALPQLRAPVIDADSHDAGRHAHVATAAISLPISASSRRRGGSIKCQCATTPTAATDTQTSMSFSLDDGRTPAMTARSPRWMGSEARGVFARFGLA